MKLFDDEAEEEQLWKVRESGLGATARIPGQPDAWEGWEDSAVPPDKVGAYLRDLRKLFDKYGYNCALYGHFGQGCVHTPHRLRPEDARGHPALPHVPGRGGRPGRRATAARSRASTATASRKRRCCPRCSAPSWSRRSASSRRSGTPTTR